MAGIITGLGGLVVGSIGAACVENNLVGVAECYLPLGVTMTSVGWSIVFLVLLAVALTQLPDKAYNYQRKTVQAAVLCFVVFAAGIVLFSVGLACLNNTLAGIEQCHKPAG